MESLVEPPEGANYVKTAYEIGALTNHSLAWVQPTPQPAGHRIEDVEISKLPLIATEVFRRDGFPQPLLGVVYADSPLTGDTRRKFGTVSVAVTGIVTLLHPRFNDKKDCSCGSFVFAKIKAGTNPERPDIEVGPSMPTPADGWCRVGMLLEVGGSGDARILLQMH